MNIYDCADTSTWTATLALAGASIFLAALAVLSLCGPLGQCVAKGVKL